MRQFLSIIVAVAIGFSGVIMSSHFSHSSSLPTPASTTEEASFLIVEAEESNAVEVDGIRFENIIEGRIFPIPEEGSEEYTLVPISLKITNHSSSSKQFTRFDNLFPQMKSQDNQLVSWDFYRNWSTLPSKEDCPIVLPGQQISFDMNFKLIWKDREIRLEAGDGFGGQWTFNHLQSGEYWIRLIYAHLPYPYQDEALSNFTVFDPEIGHSVPIDGLWEGSASPPFSKIQLITIEK